MSANRKLGVDSAHRKAMLRGLTTDLLQHGRIQTTVAKAKELRKTTEKMITLGKKNTLATRRKALAFITKEDVVTKLFNDIAPDMPKEMADIRVFLNSAKDVGIPPKWLSLN